MKICICDDELNILNDIKDFLTTIDKKAIIKSFNNPHELQNVLKKEKIDVLFMDIKLKAINGINFIKQND